MTVKSSNETFEMGLSVTEEENRLCQANSLVAQNESRPARWANFPHISPLRRLVIYISVIIIIFVLVTCVIVLSILQVNQSTRSGVDQKINASTEDDKQIQVIILKTEYDQFLNITVALKERVKTLEKYLVERENTTAEFCNASISMDNIDVPATEFKSNKTNMKNGKLLKYLHRISGVKNISGLFVNSANSLNSAQGIRTIRKIAGVFPGVVSTRMPIYSASAFQWKSFTDEVIYNWRNGHLVRIVWWWEENPLTAMEMLSIGNNAVDVERKWEDLIKEEGYFNKIWKDLLDLLAPYLQQLQTAGVITILDILPTINVKGFTWRGRPGINGTVKLYKMTHDYLTERLNLTSLIWTWSVWNDPNTKFEDYWPGSEYVDVASVYMLHTKEVTTNDYQRFLNVVGNTPISMECINIIPSPQLLASQPRWTWFTAYDGALEAKSLNSDNQVKATFNSNLVINRRSIEFFTDAQ